MRVNRWRDARCGIHVVRATCLTRVTQITSRYFARVVKPALLLLLDLRGSKLQPSPLLLSRFASVLSQPGLNAKQTALSPLNVVPCHLAWWRVSARAKSDRQPFAHPTWCRAIRRVGSVNKPTAQPGLLPLSWSEIRARGLKALSRQADSPEPTRRCAVPPCHLTWWHVSSGECKASLCSLCSCGRSRKVVNAIN